MIKKNILNKLKKAKRNVMKILKENLELIDELSLEKTIEEEKLEKDRRVKLRSIY